MTTEEKAKPVGSTSQPRPVGHPQQCPVCDASFVSIPGKIDDRICEVCFEQLTDLENYPLSFDPVRGASYRGGPYNGGQYSSRIALCGKGKTMVWITYTDTSVYACVIPLEKQTEAIAMEQRVATGVEPPAPFDPCSACCMQ